MPHPALLATDKVLWLGMGLRAKIHTPSILHTHVGKSGREYMKCAVQIADRGGGDLGELEHTEETLLLYSCCPCLAMGAGPVFPGLLPC